jgi:hypothetical protein
MSIIDIPLEFEYEGIYFQGEFLSHSGTENVWQLRLYNYHYGQLINYNTGWKWCPNIQNWFAEPFMEEFFVRVVTTGHNKLASG